MNRHKKLLNFLETNYSFRKNTISQKIEFCKVWNATNLDFSHLSDLALKKIAYEAALDMDTVFSERTTSDCIHAMLAVEYNPFHEYFEKLTINPNRVCSAGAIESLSKTIITDSEDFAEILFTWMVNCIHNIYSPIGCQNDQCLTLIGDSGVGKTTWINKLCPKDLISYKKVLNWNSPSLNKDNLMYLNNSFIIELDGLSQELKDRDRYASYFRQGDFDMRLPFKSQVEHFQRNANFICSTNSLNAIFENDYFFPPVNIERIDFDLLETIDIDKAWFEAYTEYYWIA